MTATIQPTPTTKTIATPYLCVNPAPQAIDFYKQAFGATEESRLTDDQGRVSHAEIRIGGATIFLADEHPDHHFLSPTTIGGSPVLIVLQVPDLDTFYHQALAAGATILCPLAGGPDGEDRNAKIIDPFGHHWFLTTQ